MPNNNLFNIDIDNIELLLAEANTDLLDKHVNLVNKISKIPSEISNPNEVELVQNLLTEIKSVGKQWSKTRLKDGKPFTDATKIVKNWFGHYEDYLKNKTIFLLINLSLTSSCLTLLLILELTDLFT